MSYRLLTLKEEHVNEAVELFIENYKAEQKVSKLLPNNVIENPEIVKDYLVENISKPSIAIIDKDNKLVSYMITGFKFMFKGQRSVLVQEYGHASIERDKSHLYKLMYMDLAQIWSDDGIQLHNICYFGNDKILNETLFQIGYGATLNERLRDLSNIDNIDNFTQFEITQEIDISNLIELRIEDMKYYQKSPIFCNKDTDYNSAKSSLEEALNDGDTFLVHKDKNDNKINAIFIIGKSCDEGEGLLLKDTNTAQIKHAYISGNLRGTGIGKCMLQHSITWAKENGYDRIFVEHETANFSGGIFWSKHFDTYVNVAMRYIENVKK